MSSAVGLALPPRTAYVHELGSETALNSRNQAASGRITVERSYQQVSGDHTHFAGVSLLTADARPKDRKKEDDSVLHLIYVSHNLAQAQARALSPEPQAAQADLRVGRLVVTG